MAIHRERGLHLRPIVLRTVLQCASEAERAGLAIFFMPVLNGPFRAMLDRERPMTNLSLGDGLWISS
jgi:hypothetical protein